jgi:hypothetical protein
VTWCGYKGLFHSSEVADPHAHGKGNSPTPAYTSASRNEQASVLLSTEHFSYDEDEYGSANAAAQEQIQQ